MSLSTVALGMGAGSFAVGVCDLMERWLAPPARGHEAAPGAAGRRARRVAPPAHRALRWVVYGLLLLFWFALSARLAFAVTAAIITTAVFLVISVEKYRHLKEPFVLTDFAFITHLVRHPQLFYLGWRKTLGVVLVIAGLLGLIVGWMVLEPRSIGALGQASLGAGLLALLGLALAAATLLLRLCPRAADAVTHAPAARFVAELGLLPSLVVSGLVMRAQPAPPPPAFRPAVEGEGAWDAVVIIQSESFYDLRRQGVAAELPGLDRLKQRALAHGRLKVPCYGAYTLRPEFALSTGLAFAAQGIDRFHPFLRARRFRDHALPAALGRAGWRTLFLHPYDPHFFGRARAVPLLGFQRFLDEADFAGDDRCGPYVADAAVGARMEQELAAAQAEGRPLYMMAVTMEAHDPYGPGRLPESDDPLAQYCRHLANADAMLARMAARLDAATERALLVFYGDHAPLLPGFDMLADDPRTDYLVVVCGRAVVRSGAGAQDSAPEERAPEELNAIVQRLLAAEEA